MSVRSEIERLLDGIRDRIRTIASKAIVNLIDDSTKMQLIQVDILRDETISKVERVQQYGFSSVPLSGAQAVLLSINGNKEHSVAIAVDDTRYRITGGEEGEINIYDQDGNNIKLTKSSGVFINAPNEKVVINASGDIEVGNTSLKKLVNEEFATVFNNHTHNYTPPLHPGPAPVPTLMPNSSLTTAQMTTKVKAQ